MLYNKVGVPVRARARGLVQRISFRVFFVLFLLAGIIIAGGVALYWQQVGQVLERDVRTHVASAGEEAAADFNRLLDTDRQVLVF